MAEVDSLLSEETSSTCTGRSLNVISFSEENDTSGLSSFISTTTRMTFLTIFIGAKTRYSQS